MRAPAHRSRGFTLTELMITIAIIGILATLAVYGMRGYIQASKSSEAVEMIQAIKAAEEAYKDETFTYLKVTANIDTFYPATAPNSSKVQWGAEHASKANWDALGVHPNGPVQYRYSCVAGGAGDTLPTLGTAKNLNYPAQAPGPWYVVKAVGDLDEDGTKAIFVGSNFTDEVYVENDSE